MNLPDDLAAALDRHAAAFAPLVSRIEWLPTTTSTMDVVTMAVPEPSERGLLVIADEQTAGRGRRGRTWASPVGAGLYFSLLLRPPLESVDTRGEGSTIGLLTIAAGVAIAHGIAAATGLSAELKWPNDVFVSRLKLAGVLAEGHAIGTREQAVVLGVGINVLGAAALPEGLAPYATSLEEQLGGAVNRGEVLARVLVELAGVYECLLQAKYDEVVQEWRTLSPSSIGAQVEWNTGTAGRCGVTAGVDAAGALLVQTHGGVERITGGALRWPRR